MESINKWLKENIAYIISILFVFIMAACIYGQADKNIKRETVKENRINNIESRLNEQMNYIHQLEADVDNLYRVVE